MATQDVLRMSPQELYTRMVRGEVIVPLDVRTQDALKVQPAQLPGARWLPLATVVEQAHTLPRQGTIVTY
jgi:hypothetical protein